MAATGIQYLDVDWVEKRAQERAKIKGASQRLWIHLVGALARISNLIQTSRPSGGLERLYS